MRGTEVVVSALAHDDIRKATEFYLAEGSGPVALSFLAALEATVEQVRFYPAAGSPRYAHELELPGLRHRAVVGFPYLVFYRVEGATATIWRVLHAVRDIPERLRPRGGTGR